MAPADDDQTLEARAPRLSDLVALCRHLNDEGARYLVIGGMAVIQAGFPRATGDIDLLIDTSADNQQRVRRALLYAEAIPRADIVELDGVPIPFASPELLLRMKDTYREKDKLDRAFLTQLVARRGGSEPSR